ncbi:MAG: hypothetical protein WA510_31850, partial [Acidobacteriaceae bacterium]
ALAQDAARPHEVTRPRRRNGLHMLLAEDNRSNQTVALRAVALRAVALRAVALRALQKWDIPWTSPPMAEKLSRYWRPAASTWFRWTS